MSASRPIIAEGQRLDNVHPGEILREDVLIGSKIPIAEVAARTGLNTELLGNLLAGIAPVTAAIDLRLGIYFGVSRGYFLRRQNAYDLEEVERTAGIGLARIQPRLQPTG